MSRFAYTGPPVRRTLRKFRGKFSKLNARERRFAAAALLCAPLVEVSLRAAGLQRTLRWVERLSASQRPDTVNVTPLSAERAQYVVDGVYGAIPGLGRCLPRALLQYGLQRREGTDVRFVIGVKPPGQDALDAHAWVELADGPSRSTDFAPILRAGTP